MELRYWERYLNPSESIRIQFVPKVCVSNLSFLDESIPVFDQDAKANIQLSGWNLPPLFGGEAAPQGNIKRCSFVMGVKIEQVIAKEMIGGIAKVYKGRIDHLYPRFISAVIGSGQSYIPQNNVQMGAFGIKEIVRGITLWIAYYSRLLPLNERIQLLLKQDCLILHVAGLVSHHEQCPQGSESRAKPYYNECPVWPKWRVPGWWPMWRLIGGAVLMGVGAVMIVHYGYRRLRLGLLGSGLFAVGWLLLLAPICW